LKGDYELYRLYKNGKRADIEEQFNIAKQSPEIVKDLAIKLEKYLKEYDAKFPYKSIANTKDASEKENIAAVPTIIGDTFDKKSRKVSIQLEKRKTNVIESYALIKIADEVKVKKNGKKGKLGKHSTTYIKIPVDVSKNNLEYSFIVPKEAIEYGIILIDANRYMVKGEFHNLTSSKTAEKEKKGKKRKKVKKQK
jgi:hypothetical protein